MQEWWSSLDGVIQFFYIVAIPATLILIIQTIITLIGISSGDMDIGSDTDGGDFGDGIDLDGDGIPDFTAGFRMFSIRGIVAFFSVFGWVGVILAENHNWIFTFIIALISGLVAMFLMAFLFYQISKLQSSGNINFEAAVGKTATVYLRIPGKQSGKGKIHIILKDSLIEMNAVTDEENLIKTGELVIVEKVLESNTALVKSGALNK